MRFAVMTLADWVAVIEVARHFPWRLAGLPPHMEGAPSWRSELECGYRIWLQRNWGDARGPRPSRNWKLRDPPTSSMPTVTRSLASEPVKEPHAPTVGVVSYDVRYRFELPTFSKLF